MPASDKSTENWVKVASSVLKSNRFILYTGSPLGPDTDPSGSRKTNIVAKLDVPPPYSLPKILTTIFCNVAG